MIRYWLNLKTLRQRFNDLEYGPAATDAERWIGQPLGWFSDLETMNAYIRAEMIPALEAAWKSNPALRLGQLISAATPGDVFYVPDGELRDGLRDVVS